MNINSIAPICAKQFREAKRKYYDHIYFFFREDDLLTCKNQQKTKQNNNIRAHGKKLITFPLH